MSAGPLDVWPCGAWPEYELVPPPPEACGRDSVDRLVFLNPNLPDVALCLPHLVDREEVRFLMGLRGKR